MSDHLKAQHMTSFILYISSLPFLSAFDGYVTGLFSLFFPFLLFLRMV